MRLQPLLFALLWLSSVTCAARVAPPGGAEGQGPPAAAAEIGGVDHVGLAVTRLEETRALFVEELGFRQLRFDPDYPAYFLDNGAVIVTLWRVEDPAEAVPFDRRRNVGLHHLALAVASFEDLDALHARLSHRPDVRIEFAPEPLSGGPARHMMFYGPSGNRLELIYRPTP